MSREQAEFVLARVEEDAAAARAVQPLGRTTDMGGRTLRHWFSHSRTTYAGEDGMPRREGDVPARQHFDRWQPERVLAECDAKRRIVRMYLDGFNVSDFVVESLALPYADHPAYRPGG